MNPTLLRCAVVGHGRLGTALAAAFRGAGLPVDGPLGRGADPRDAEVVLLCVPDAEIAAAAACLTPRPGLLVGHCSGATTLEPLRPHAAFSLHPLMTVPETGARFAGVPCAVAADGEPGRATALALAEALAMAPFAVADADRAAYHASASIASNFLVALEWAAERVGGLDRTVLAPLVRASVEHWIADGPQRALTGPISRGDEATVAAQRAAVAQRTPDLVPLFDALADTTRALAASRRTAVAA
jgi:predicted short-subunit dehydrogenase-like oxidoreductase (DUF2520 family)